MTTIEGPVSSSETGPSETRSAAKQLRLIQGSAGDRQDTPSSDLRSVPAAVRARSRWRVRGCQCEPCLLRRPAARERRRMKSLREQQEASR